MAASQYANLINLYINPDHYNPAYNFYNYHKFKQTGIINIIYRTPSIFLNGLYFEFPFAKIIAIRKASNTTTMQLTLLIDPAAKLNGGCRTISELLTQIDTYNKTFFDQHRTHLEYRQTNTNKNQHYHLNSYPQQNSFKNPLNRKYDYTSFISTDVNGFIILTVDIKQLYLYKILSAIAATGIEAQPGLTAFCNSINEIVNKEYFEFKQASFEHNIAPDCQPNVKFWLKANTLESGRYNIHMIWKVCGYRI
jgi:hypothetical protein